MQVIRFKWRHKDKTETNHSFFYGENMGGSYEKILLS